MSRQNLSRPQWSPVDELRVWYALLQIGTPSQDYSDQTAERHIQTVEGELKSAVNLTLRRLDLKCSEGSHFAGLYLYRFPEYRRNDPDATHLAEAFVYAFSLVAYPALEVHHDSLTLRIPHSLVSRIPSPSLRDLIALEEARPPEYRCLDYPLATIGTVGSTVASDHEAAWRVAAVTFNEPRLFDATRFLTRSQQNFYVYPGQIQDVLDQPEAIPNSASRQTDFEEALHNAFKAIEAVVGDPPKDNRRFFKRLEAIGIDPMEEVGFENRVPIYSLIREMNEARNKRAAHGSTQPRTIRVSELLNFQGCAAEIVFAAVEKARRSANLAPVWPPTA